jgi:hypothetical protein
MDWTTSNDEELPPHGGQFAGGRSLEGGWGGRSHLLECNLKFGSKY